MYWFSHFLKKKQTLKLSIKAIIRWEQLNDKSFYLLDNDNENEVLSLFYTCTTADEVGLSFDNFKRNIRPQKAARMARDFARQIAYISQFQAVGKKTNKKKSTEPQNTDPPRIKDVAGMLVMNGLDVSYVLNDMQLCDIEIFLHANDQIVRDRLITQRLWAFMQLMPHLDKGTTPKDIQPFSWEVDDEDIVTPPPSAADKNAALIFLKTGLKK